MTVQVQPLTIAKVLAIVALVVVIGSFFVPGPLIAIAVILLCLALIVG